MADGVTRHLLRNSMLPIITLVGLSLPVVLSGAIIVEALFNYPGHGLAVLDRGRRARLPGADGVHRRRRRAPRSIGNLLADIAYAVADPRVRYS